jgi:hypothetical protein
MHEFVIGISGFDQKKHQEIKAHTLANVRGTVQPDILREDQAQNGAFSVSCGSDGLWSCGARRKSGAKIKAVSLVLLRREVACHWSTAARVLQDIQVLRRPNPG